jgi:isocitrate dehydrogenase
MGETITKNGDGTLNVPDNPTIPFIEGDGIGPDIWRATRMVIDAAVKTAYDGRRSIDWLEVDAGEKGFERTGEWLPEKTLDTIRSIRGGHQGTHDHAGGQGHPQPQRGHPPAAGSVRLRPAGPLYPRCRAP